MSYSSTPGAFSNQSTITSQVPYTNPWAGNFSGTLPPNGNGSLYAWQCQNLWYSYTSINTDYITATNSLYYITSTIRSVTVTIISTYYSTSFYTLCDGHPRVITSEPTATSTTILLPSTTTILAEGLSAASFLEPSCTINYMDCSALWTTYWSASSVYTAYSFEAANTVVSLGLGASYLVVNGITTTYPAPVTAMPTISIGTEEVLPYDRGGWTWIIVTTPPPGGLFLEAGYTLTPGGVVTIEHDVSTTATPYTPHCNTDAPTCTPGARCMIDGDRVRLFYFPPQTNVSRDMCATAPVGGGITSRPPANLTWTPITTGPYTVLPGDTTWYSGNVYLSLEHIHAYCNWSSRAVDVGGDHSGEFLTLAPSEVYSQRAYPITTGQYSGMVGFDDYAYSFNWADLVSPYPWSAWDSSFDCVEEHCSIINGSYNPWLAVPDAIRRLDPRWATCDLSLYGLYDPPVAVSSVGNIFATSTFVPQSTPATPPQGPQSIVSPTNTPPKPKTSSLGPLGGFSAQPSLGGGSPANTAQPADPKTSDAQGIPPQTGGGNGGNGGNTDPTTIATVGSQPIVVDPSDPGGVVVGGSTLKPGSPGTTIANTPVSVGTGGVIIGGSTVAIPPASPPIATAGGLPIVTDPSTPGAVVVGGTTLSAGGPGTVIGGTSVSVLDPSHVIIGGPGGSTVSIPGAAPTPFTTVGGLPVVTDPASPGTVVVGGHTLSVGGTGTVIDGTTLSVLDPSQIVVGGPGGTSTIAIPTPAPTSGVVITAPNGQVLTATNSGGSVVVSGVTLYPGGPAATLPNGLVVSDATSGLVIGGSSTLLFSSLAPVPTSGAVITLGGQVYTATNSGGSVIIGSLTLSPGGPAYTISGVVVSDATTGLVVGSTTVPFSTLPGATATGPLQYQGSAAEKGVTSSTALFVAFVAALVCI